jgi:hypothetical protein
MSDVTTAIVKRDIGTGERGLAVRSMGDLIQLAEAAVASQLAPQGFKTVQAAFVAMQLGMELGLPPMTSLRSIAVINGRPSLYGDAQKGLVESSGLCEYCKEYSEGEGEKYTAVCEVKRVGRPNAVRQTFSATDAKRAGKLGQPGPWTQYPKRMMQMRARSFALRDAFPDVLQGMLSVEEARDIAPEAGDVSVTSGQPNDPPASQAASLNAMLNEPAVEITSPITPEEAERIKTREAAEAAEGK